MCGILGFTGKGSEADAKKMLSALSHRGPDDSGIFASEKATLGHARLSIIDLTKEGHQPMWTRGKDLAIVFNGEIYNFKTLREDLIKKGHTFQSTSDTEVILHLYKEYGLESFKMLEGMFAFGLFDSVKNELILVRDRIGKKPLYYCVRDGNLIFASELKSIMAHSSVQARLDMTSLHEYLLYDYVPTPYTMVKDVYKLEPASYLVFKNGLYSIQKFWQIPSEKYQRTFKNALHELNQQIERSVRERLVSDVPLGVFLSGGLDSSAVAYYAQKNSQEKIKTFSISFDDISFDESKYALKVAEHLGTDHSVFKVTHKEMLEVVPKLAKLVDEPIADASIIPTYLLSKHTKEKVTVALGGDGGDELFAGYPTFNAFKIRSVYEKIPTFLKKGFVEPFIRRLPANHENFSFSFKAKKFIEGEARLPHHVHQEWLGSFQKEERDKLLTSQAKNGIDPDDLFKKVDRYYAEFTGDLGNKILFTYLRSYLMDEVMVKVDRASMMASLEARSPLLDHHVVELAFSFPYEWKLKGMTNKFIFKELMKNKLPLDIVYREKKGFGMPIGAWFKNELRDFIDDLLSKESIESRGIFNYKYIQQLKEEHFNGRHDHRKKLWNLMVFELWRREYGL